MSNQLLISGGQPQKPTRFAPIYTGRWSSGIWTNRSPLRDANTTRQAEKFYGSNGDALIDGLNVEVTNRLTLARRPGNPVYDNNSYTAVGNIDNFRMFGPNTERIDVMIDQANALYSLYNGTKTLVWTKSSGAGQSYLQSVGNTLYFGNGIDNKKWLQSLTSWSANANWNTATTPFLSTFFIDPNGNIQQLTATAVPISSTSVTSNVLTVNSSQTLTSVLSVGLEITFPSGMTSSFLSGETVTVLSVGSTSFTAAFTHSNYGPTSETNKTAIVNAGGTPISAGSQPTWSTTVPSSGNNFQGGTTIDGTVQWTNRGNPVENWGINPPTGTVTPQIGSSRVAWAANTYYSNPGVVIDSNGNLQEVTADGKSGSSAPTWATVVGNTTTDGTVTWTMIQNAASLVWQPNHAYAAGDYVVGNAGGTNCLFRVQASNAISIGSTVDAWNWNSPHSGPVGCFILPFPTSTGTSLSHATGNSLLFDYGSHVGVNPMLWSVIDGAGNETSTTTPFPGTPTDFMMVVKCDLVVPAAGQYTFTIAHHDGMIWGIGNGATCIAGPVNDPFNHTQTAVSGYPVFGGNNVSGSNTDQFVVNFPAAGTYPIEIDYDFWYHSGQTLSVLINGSVPVSGTPTSGSTEPVWPGFTTNFAPNYPTVSEANGTIIWENLGPTSDMVWSANVNFTLPNQQIIDANGFTEAPFRTGISGSVAPTFATGLNQLTNDNPNLIWINQGTAIAPPPGSISTFNGGWKYCIALVNSLDDTVSNCTPLSAATGNFIGANVISLPAGSGLPDPSLIDPQCDYVAVFRTTDGLSVPFLIPGDGNSTWTVPLSEYLANGYQDTTPDTGLNNLVEGAIAGENTPPLAGAVNLTYHLNRIFFSVGNVVYWTSGPDTPVGNGVNGVAPLNFDVLPSLVKRIVPTSIGALVFTVSDVFLITGQGTSANPIQNAQPFLEGVGLLSYNALDVNGSIIGLFTTDKQFIILDPTSGVSYAGFPIGDKLRKDNGQAGTNWDASNVYVSWHVDGEDQAWYVADGEFGWYRMMPTPSPETGLTWSPFAKVVGGCKAVKSVEVTPGVHKLLLGPTGTGPILNRDLDTFTDNGSTYSAYAVIGSAVLAQPGQIAEVSFITTDCVAVGKPLQLSVLIDEALPYYTGPFESLNTFVNDPPTLPKSRSIVGQRFYMSSLKQAAVCRHMQMRIDWLPEAVQNELLTLTVFGAYNQEL